MKYKAPGMIFSLAIPLLLVSLAGGGLVFDRTLKAEKAFEESRAMRKYLEDQSDDAKRTKAFFENSKEKTAGVEGYFISESEIVSLIEELETAARRSGVELKVAAASLPPASQTGPAFELKASGEFENLFHYLVLLENFPHMLAVEKADLSKVSLWEMQITIRLLSYESS